MGAEFAKNSWVVLTIISFSSFIGGLSAIPNLIILGRGNSKLIGLFSILTIILYIISLPLLTKFFGIIGTAIALLITSCGVIYYVIIKTTEYTKINKSEFLNFVLRPHLNFFILGALLLPVVVINGNQKPIVVFTFGIILMLLHYLFLMRKELIPIKNIYPKLFQNI
jgi:O-antigen/teichoic acid export membrane protein